MASFRNMLGDWRVLGLLPSRYTYTPKRLMCQKVSSIQYYHDPAICMRILACQGIDDSLRRNLLDRTVSRSLPNGRLTRAFGIENSFTTMDDDDRLAFRRLAGTKLIGNDKEQWKNIGSLAKQILHERIRVIGEGQMRIHLITLVQLLSLKISLHFLFQQDTLALDDRAVSSLAWTINALWILSKDPSPNEEQMKFHQNNLSKDLDCLLPNYSSTYPGEPPTCLKETPMNFIIPAYETLWRIVLHTFIEVAFRHPSSAAAWRSVLADYMAEPTTAQFSQRFPEFPGTTPSVSAEDIAKEALRLYPPTKRIYRTFQYSTCPELVTVAADIEHIHRNPNLWGSDSTMYIPGRWAAAGKVSQKFFPFGASPMHCPAQAKFGAMMISMLVAALVNTFGPGGWWLEGDEAGEAEMKEWMNNPSQPLDSSRKAHASIFLCKNNRDC